MKFIERVTTGWALQTVGKPFSLGNMRFSSVSESWKFSFYFCRFLDSVKYHRVSQNPRNHQNHWVSLSFKAFGDFMKFTRQVVTGRPHCRELSPRKRAFPWCFKKSWKNEFQRFQVFVVGTESSRSLDIGKWRNSIFSTPNPWKSHGFDEIQHFLNFGEI